MQALLLIYGFHLQALPCETHNYAPGVHPLVTENLPPASLQFLIDILVDANIIFHAIQLLWEYAMADLRNLSLVLPVVDQPVVHIGSRLSLYQRRRCGYRYQIGNQRADLVERSDQIIRTFVGIIDLQRLNVQPAVLPNVEKAVVCLIVLLLVMVPVGRLIQSEQGMHTQAQKPVLIIRSPVELAQPVVKILFQKAQASRGCRNQLQNMFLQLFGHPDPAERHLILHLTAYLLENLVGDREWPIVLVIYGVLMLRPYGRLRRHGLESHHL